MATKHFYCVEHNKVTEEACCGEAVEVGWVEHTETVPTKD